MRALVLVVAVVLCAGSAKNAQQRHALNTYSCGSRPAAQQANCYATANTTYAVESQQEMVDQQNARDDAQRAAAANQVIGQRCDRVAGIMMNCRIGTPADFDRSRTACTSALGGQWPAGYSTTVCVEQAGSCDQVTWCLQQAAAPATVKAEPPH